MWECSFVMFKPRYFFKSHSISFNSSTELLIYLKKKQVTRVKQIQNALTNNQKCFEELFFDKQEILFIKKSVQSYVFITD